MKNFKKVLSIIICVMMVMAMFSCCVSAEDTATTEVADTEAETTKDSKEVAAEELNEFGITDSQFEEMIDVTKENISKDVFEPFEISENEFDWEAMFPKESAVWPYFFVKTIAITSNTPVMDGGYVVDETSLEFIMVDTVVNSMYSIFDEDDIMAKTNFMNAIIKDGEPEEKLYEFVTKYFSFSEEESEEMEIESEAETTGK